MPSEEEPARARRRRALEEPLDVRWDARALVVSAEVRNPKHRTHYRVYFPAYPARDGRLCTCPDFSLRGLGTCKHLEAAAMALDESETPIETEVLDPQAVRAVWRAVDRERATRTGNESPPLAIRRAGRALIDPGVP